MYAQPVARGATFKPSGDPARDPPEVSKESWDDEIGRLIGLDTPEGRDRWDAGWSPDYLARSIRENQYWEQRRFRQGKSLRAKKRELEREARRPKG